MTLNNLFRCSVVGRTTPTVVWRGAVTTAALARNPDIFRSVCIALCVFENVRITK